MPPGGGGGVGIAAVGRRGATGVEMAADAEGGSSSTISTEANERRVEMAFDNKAGEGVENEKNHETKNYSEVMKTLKHYNLYVQQTNYS